jgi:mRNA interferase MazF
MAVRRGDVVLLQVPFTAGGGMKIRPMLVVQNDLNNGRMANTILALITSNTSRSTEPTQVLIDVNSAEGRQSGLKQNSVISCENILTVLQSDIIRGIGNLPMAVMQAVDQALKTSLGLS